MGFRELLGLRRKERVQPADLHCTFCGKSGVEAKKMIGGPPPFYICDGCVGSHSETVAREQARLAALPRGCSFCRKARRQVGVLVGDERATICEECLGLCRDILEAELGRPLATNKKKPSERSSEG
jgi:ATP-dependent protease Clp ATPase subunit